jgi:hypothetical protein
LWCFWTWKTVRCHHDDSKCFNLAHFTAAWSVYSSIENCPRRILSCCVWSLGQSE